MKKQYIFPMVGFCAVMLSTACNDDNFHKNDFTHPAGGNSIFFDCQSQLDENSQVIWAADSKIGFFCEQIGSTNASIGVAAPSVGQKNGFFYTQMLWSKTADEHTFYLYTPYNAANTSVTAIAGTLDGVQVQSGASNTHLTKNALTYASATSSEVELAIPMNLKHALGYLDVNCKTVAKYAGWNVKSIELSNEDAISFTGNYHFNLTTEALTTLGGSPKVLLRVNDAPALALGVTFHGYISINPVNLSSKQCDVSVVLQKADEADLNLKGVIAPGNLISGGFTSLALNLDDMQAETLDDASINLSENETANCYVADKAGQEYRFKATVMGNGVITPAVGPNKGITPSALSPKSAQILWQTSKGLVSGVQLKNGYVYFTLNGSDEVALTAGNVAIAAYSQPNFEGDIIWSWHIWVTNADLDNKLETYTIHADYQGYDQLINPQMMDRHLGATSSGYWGLNSTNEAQGLYYQWGRKDPYPRINDTSKTSAVFQSTYMKEDVEIGGMAVATDFTKSNTNWACVKKSMSKEDIAKYPMCFAASGAPNWLIDGGDDLWGNPVTTPEENNIGDKTIYDPCPPGYRVPPAYVWTGFTNLALGGSTNTGGVTLNLASGEKADIATNGGGTFSVGSTPTYPNSGYLNNTDALIKNPGVRMYVWSSGIASTSNGYAGIMYDGSNNFFTPRSQAKSFGNPVRCMKIK